MSSTTEHFGSASGLPGLSRLRGILFGARARILVWFVLLMSAAAFLSFFFLRQVLLSRLDDRISADLVQEVDELRQLIGGVAADGTCVTDMDGDGVCDLGRDPSTGEPFGTDIEAIFDTFLRRNLPAEHETMITFVDGEPFEVPFPDPPVPLVSDPRFTALADVGPGPEEGELEVDGVGTVRYLAVPVTSAAGERLGVFAVAAFVDLQREGVDSASTVAAGVLAVTLLLATGAAWLSAGRVLAPVRMVTETARTISETDLGRRIPVEGDDEISELARTFNDMLDRIEVAFAAQRSFVDDAGHELRTPITIIRGHLELLTDDPAERRETLELVTDELDRMSRMVNDLLVLATAERPDFLTLDSVDVEDLTVGVFHKLTALGDRDWRLMTKVRGVVRGDPQRLTQAVVQLAQNAVQHTGEGDVVSFGSRTVAGGIELFLTDTGSGVHPDDAERIFQRFARASAAPRRSGGAGLGLSIVQAIAEAHGGAVRLEGGHGRGATFRVFVPTDTAMLHTVETDPART